MRSRLASVVLATAVVGLTLSGLAWAVVQSPEQRAQERAADAVAADYSTRLDRYVTATSAAITSQRDKDLDDYQDLLALLERRVDGAPRPPTQGTTAYGRAHSDAYRSLAERRRLALGRFTDLSDYLEKRAVPDSRFIVAGRKLVTLSPGKLLADVPVVGGSALRELVLPAYEKARRRLDRQATPPRQELLALDLMTYAEDLIEMTEAGAERLDAGQPFFFRLGDRPAALLTRLAALEAAIQTAISSRVDVL